MKKQQAHAAGGYASKQASKQAGKPLIDVRHPPFLRCAPEGPQAGRDFEEHTKAFIEG